MMVYECNDILKFMKIVGWVEERNPANPGTENTKLPGFAALNPAYGNIIKYNNDHGGRV